jgi:hypothetical protein
LSSKLLVIVGTGDREKAQTALMYAHNAMRRGWFDDIKVVYFGPSEKLVVEDPIIADQAQEIAEAGGSIACKYISDRDGVSEKFEKLGVQVEYVGSIVSDLIKDGYTPMVW